MPTTEIKRHTKRSKVGQLAAEAEAEIEAGKVHYSAADEAMERLLKLASAGDEIEMPDGSLREVHDNFTDPKTGAPRNKAFKPAGITRFSLKPKAKKEN
jgi:hypothetical protein